MITPSQRILTDFYSSPILDHPPWEQHRTHAFLIRSRVAGTRLHSSRLNFSPPHGGENRLNVRQSPCRQTDKGRQVHPETRKSHPLIPVQHQDIAPRTNSSPVHEQANLAALLEQAASRFDKAATEAKGYEAVSATR